MTFMLKDVGEVRMQPATAVPDRGERVQAQFRLDRVTGDSMGLQSGAAERALLSEITDALGQADGDTETGRRRSRHGRSFDRDRARAVDRVKELRAFDPDTFGGLPASVEEFNAEVLRRRRDEVEELQDLLGAAPAGGWAPELAGSLGAGMRDEWTLLTLPFGAGGGASVLRTAAIEAVAGAGGEALSFPDQYRAAEELDTPAPDPLLQLGVAAGLSGAIGGAAAGAARFLSYGRERQKARQAQRPGTVEPLTFSDALDQAERELTGQAQPERADRPDVPLSMGDFDFSAKGNASPQDNRIGYVFGKLLIKGMPPHIAAGFLGNFMVEAGVGLNPSIRGDGGAAHGIAQWNDRADALKAFASARGKYWFDLDTQIEFLFHELETTEAGAWSRIQGARSAEDAARLIAKYYERPGIPHTSRRVGHARDVFSQYSQGSVPRWSGQMPADTGFTGYTTSRAYTGTGEVTVGDDMRVNVEYEIVDLRDLRQASGDLQPRDRDRIASDAWVADTAARLDPAQLMDSPWADRGAPLVGPDNVIESGNGRVRAIERAYEQGTDRADAYRDQIASRTGQPIPDDIERPVLIARRTTELDDTARRRLVVDAQDSGVARMNATERAQVGQRAMSRELMDRFDPSADLTSAANRDFARAFASFFPRSERNAFIAQDGSLSIDGVRQIQDSLFARAFDAPDILARYAETAPGELKSLMDALAAASPRLAVLRAAIDAGDVRPEMDITDFILDAARLIMTAREIAATEGGRLADVVDELLEAVDMLDGAAIAPLTAALVRKMMPGGRQAPAKQIADFLSRYADEALQSGRTGDALMDPPGPLDVLKALDRETFGALEETGRAGHVEPAAPAAIEDLPPDAFAAGADSPEARMGDAQAEADLRESVAATSEDGDAAPDAAEFDALRQDLGEFTFETPDGQTVRASDLLDDLEADADLEAALDACPTGRSV